MRTLEEKLNEVKAAAEHLGRAYDLLFELGYTGLANSVSELLDEVSDEIADHEMEQEPDCDDSDDGYALASIGWGTDEDYGSAEDTL